MASWWWWINSQNTLTILNVMDKLRLSINVQKVISIALCMINSHNGSSGYLSRMVVQHFHPYFIQNIPSYGTFLASSSIHYITFEFKDYVFLRLQQYKYMSSSKKIREINLYATTMVSISYCRGLVVWITNWSCVHVHVYMWSSLFLF